MKKLIIILTIIISILFYIKEINTKQIELIKESDSIEDIYIFNNILNNNLKNLEINLETDNMLKINIIDKKDKISFIEFDSNKLELIENKDGIKIFTSTYEMIPKTGILTIYYENIEPMIMKINLTIKYSMNKNINNFNNQWDIKKERLKINKNNIYINKKENTILSYQKKFDYNKEIKVKTILSFKEYKNMDFKIAYGDRIYFSFDNKNINAYIKEKTNKIKLVKYNISKNFTFEKDKIYTIILNIIPIIKENEPIKYKYIISISDDKNNLELEFLDEGKNKLEFERYKEFKYIFNNIGTEIINIEI